MSSKKKQKVQLRRMNWDVEYYKDLISGNGFTITEPAEVKTDEGVTKCLYGSQSPLYGTTYSDEHAFITDVNVVLLHLDNLKVRLVLFVGQK